MAYPGPPNSINALKETHYIFKDLDSYTKEIKNMTRARKENNVHGKRKPNPKRELGLLNGKRHTPS